MSSLFLPNGGYRISRGENSELHIGTPKTKNSIRKIVLDADTLRDLKQWHNYQRVSLLATGNPVAKNKQLVFSSNENTLYNPTIDRAWLDSIYKQDETIKKITSHGFRHTHASLLFEAGATIKEVQERLGHADITTTMNIYAHVTESAKERTADLFAKFMSN